MKTSVQPKKLQASRPKRQLKQEHLSSRDRLLAAIESAPIITEHEAKLINEAVREAREASLADTISS